MKFAICSDEPYPIHDFVVRELKRLGHEVLCFGSVKSGREENFVEAAKFAALAIAREECDEGIFFCYSGTGITIVANKVRGIRAALCFDAESARIARIWNHANVLALSNRLASETVVSEILTTWLSTKHEEKGAQCVADILKLEDEFFKQTQ